MPVAIPLEYPFAENELSSYMYWLHVLAKSTIVNA